MEGVFDWVAAHGAPALFLLLMLGVVGLPIPDETLLVFSGFLISQGRLNPTTTFFAAVAGSWCGITLSYTIGRTLGLGAVHRYGKYVGITDQRLEQVHYWFNRVGHWALFVGYYIAGVRHFTAIVAGTSKLEFRSFAAYAWSGGLVWVSTFLTLGYFIGENWKAIAEAVHHYLGIGSVVLLVLVLAYYLLRRLKIARQSKPPG